MTHTDLDTYQDFASYPNHAAGHTLTKKGRCSCGRWEIVGSSEVSLVKSHQHHVSMIQLPKAKPTQPDPYVSTFPEAFEPMRDAMVETALHHPEFSWMDVTDVTRSVEHRLWSLIQTRNLKPDQVPPLNVILVKR